MINQASVRLDPVFVMGYSRSGTTMFRLMLNHHPQLFIPKESEYFQLVPPRYRNKIHRPEDTSWLINDLPKYGYGELLDRDYFQELLQHNLPGGNEVLLACLYQACAVSVKDAAAVKKGEVRWGEKKPQNWQFVYRLRQWYPESQFVHITRDPRDVIASVEEYTHENAARKNRKFVAEGKFVPLYLLSAWQWRFLYKTMLKQGEILGEKRYLKLKYENLVAEPPIHLQKVCQFLDLDTSYVEEMTNFQADARNNKIQETSEERKPHMMETTRKVNTSRIGRYEKSLSKKKLQEIEFICEDVMKEMGYQKLYPELPLIEKMRLKSLCNLLTISWLGVRMGRRLIGSL